MKNWCLKKEIGQFRRINWIQPTDIKHKKFKFEKKRKKFNSEGSTEFSTNGHNNAWKYQVGKKIFSSSIIVSRQANTFFSNLKFSCFMSVGTKFGWSFIEIKFFPFFSNFKFFVFLVPSRLNFLCPVGIQTFPFRM